MAGVFQTYASNDKELLQALKEFNDFRNKKKKPMTDEAKRRFCRKLEKFPKEQWIDIIRQSIDQGWTDIYPLKEAEKPTVAKSASISGDPNKWASSPPFLQAIQDLLAEAGSDGRYHGKV